MPLKISLHELAENQKNNILNKGFDYKDQIFKRTMSKLLFQDAIRSGILSMMENVIYELIERVKGIKIQFNYIVRKNYRDFN